MCVRERERQYILIVAEKTTIIAPDEFKDARYAHNCVKMPSIRISTQDACDGQRVFNIYYILEDQYKSWSILHRFVVLFLASHMLCMHFWDLPVEV